MPLVTPYDTLDQFMSLKLGTLPHYHVAVSFTLKKGTHFNTQANSGKKSNITAAAASPASTGSRAKSNILDRS